MRLSNVYMANLLNLTIVLLLQFFLNSNCRQQQRNFQLQTSLGQHLFQGFYSEMNVTEQDKQIINMFLTSCQIIYYEYKQMGQFKNIQLNFKKFQQTTEIYFQFRLNYQQTSQNLQIRRISLKQELINTSKTDIQKQVQIQSIRNQFKQVTQIFDSWIHSKFQYQLKKNILINIKSFADVTIRNQINKKNNLEQYFKDQKNDNDEIIKTTSFDDENMSKASFFSYANFKEKDQSSQISLEFKRGQKKSIQYYMLKRKLKKMKILNEEEIQVLLKSIMKIKLNQVQKLMQESIIKKLQTDSSTSNLFKLINKNQKNEEKKVQILKNIKLKQQKNIKFNFTKSLKSQKMKIIQRWKTAYQKKTKKNTVQTLKKRNNFTKKTKSNIGIHKKRSNSPIIDNNPKSNFKFKPNFTKHFNKTNNHVNSNKQKLNINGLKNKTHFSNYKKDQTFNTNNNNLKYKKPQSFQKKYQTKNKPTFSINNNKTKLGQKIKPKIILNKNRSTINPNKYNNSKINFGINKTKKNFNIIKKKPYIIINKSSQNQNQKKPANISSQKRSTNISSQKKSTSYFPKYQKNKQNTIKAKQYQKIIKNKQNNIKITKVKTLKNKQNYLKQKPNTITTNKIKPRPKLIVNKNQSDKNIFKHRPHLKSSNVNIKPILLQANSQKVKSFMSNNNNHKSTNFVKKIIKKPIVKTEFEKKLIIKNPINFNKKPVIKKQEFKKVNSTNFIKKIIKKPIVKTEFEKKLIIKNPINFNKKPVIKKQEFKKVNSTNFIKKIIKRPIVKTEFEKKPIIKNPINFNKKPVIKKQEFKKVNSTNFIKKIIKKPIVKTEFEKKPIIKNPINFNKKPVIKKQEFKKINSTNFIKKVIKIPIVTLNFKHKNPSNNQGTNLLSKLINDKSKNQLKSKIYTIPSFKKDSHNGINFKNKQVKNQNIVPTFIPKQNTYETKVKNFTNITNSLSQYPQNLQNFGFQQKNKIQQNLRNISNFTLTNNFINFIHFFTSSELSKNNIFSFSNQQKSYFQFDLFLNYNILKQQKNQFQQAQNFVYSQSFEAQMNENKSGFNYTLLWDDNQKNNSFFQNTNIIGKTGGKNPQQFQQKKVNKNLYKSTPIRNNQKPIIKNTFENKFVKSNPINYNRSTFYQKPNIKPVNLSITSSVKTLKQAKRPVGNVNVKGYEKKKIIFKANNFQNKRGLYQNMQRIIK